MADPTVEGDVYNGVAPGTRASAAGGIIYGGSDELVPAVAVLAPLTIGTNFSWPRSLAMFVTANGGSNHLSNRRLSLGSAAPNGAHFWFKANSGAYIQAAGPAAAALPVNGGSPAGYTEIVALPALYDNTSVAATNGQKNGAFALTAIGLDNLFTGPSQVDAMPDLFMSYDVSV